MSVVDVQQPVTNGIANGHANGHVPAGDVEMNGVGGSSNLNEATARFATGLILPPPEIKSIIDRTASFVARSANPIVFEDKVREGQRSDPKFAFLNPADPYHAYYRHKMQRISDGEEDEATTGKTDGVEESAKAQVSIEVEDILNEGGIIPLEPPPTEFLLDVPPISALDLDIIKLTALFTARRGRPFLQTLAQREARNYEFDFLRPTHSLFGYFNSLVEQYSKVLLPSKEILGKLQRGAEEGAKWKMLDVAKQHAEWERRKREKEKRKADDKEAEKIAFAEIDWHDYAIVQTIEFTAADVNSELPPPMTVGEMVSRTLAQKKMAAMIMEDAAVEVEAHRARQAAADLENAGDSGEAGETMDVGDDEDVEAQERKKRDEEERQREIERARAIQATSMDTSGPMKIRTDYVPKLGAKNQKVAMTTCQICGQQIPLDELAEHTRIELLDPRWKEQRDMLEARRSQLSELQKGADVETSLRKLARARTDIFGSEVDEDKRKQEEAAEQERRREREKNVWDGHTASKDRTLDKYQTTTNFEEQIAQIHRTHGLGPLDPSAPGPTIGPSAGPGYQALPPPPPSLPAPPHQQALSSNPAFAAATVSVGPQPASMPMYGGGMPPQLQQPIPSGAPTATGGAPPIMLPPLHYSGLDPNQPFSFQPPGASPPSPMGAIGMHPSRMANLSPPVGVGTPPIPQTGMVRSADQMMLDGGGAADGVSNDGLPPAKRQRVAKLPGGQFYPEQNWIDLHPVPISVQIQLPNDPSKPDWKLDGSVVTLPDVPVTYVVSTLRDHLARQIGSGVPLSRIMLSFGGKMLTNANTLASYNIEDEDMLVLTVRDAKKKK